MEDNLDTAESLRRLLSLCGCQVVVAHTSQEGLDAASWLHPLDPKVLLGELAVTM